MYKTILRLLSVATSSSVARPAVLHSYPQCMQFQFSHPPTSAVFFLLHIHTLNTHTHSPYTLQLTHKHAHMEVVEAITRVPLDSREMSVRLIYHYSLSVYTTNDGCTSYSMCDNPVWNRT